MKKILFATVVLALVAALLPAGVARAGYGLPPSWNSGGRSSSPPPAWQYSSGRSEDPGFWPDSDVPRFARFWQISPVGLRIGGVHYGGHTLFAPTSPNRGVIYQPVYRPPSQPASRPTPRPRPTARPQPQCTPRYASPSLYVDARPYNPPHPVVIGQDPLKTGVDVTFKASGGRKTNACPRGDAQKALTSFRVLEIRLSEKSREWILQDLGHIYPGAYIKGQYPLPFTVKTRRLGFSGVLTIHFDPPDPGFYEIKVEVTQSDGQRTVKWFSVPVYLLETELIH